jgi:protein-S-isoprenylcysteine O-methyltransferase Ste14
VYEYGGAGKTKTSWWISTLPELLINVQAKGYMNKDSIKLSSIGKQGILKNFTNVVMEFLFLFGSAGTLFWVRGWMFVCYRFSYQIFYISVLMILNPQLLNERGKFNLKETKRYDRYFVISYFILGPSMLIIAGFDHRFQWSSIPFIAIYPSIVILILTSCLALWAILSNSHFILTTRNDTLDIQQVCTTGPYKYIRHPGYFSMILQWFSYPFILGSVFSLIPAFIYIAFIFLRTYYEDQTLKKELKGYEEYVHTTKYRLFPFIW